MENQETAQTEVAIKVESTELAVIIQSSGIEPSKAQSITANYLPFLQKIAEVEMQTNKINFADPTPLDEKLSRMLRLSLVPNRTACDKFKKQQKAEYALINGLNDNCYGIVEKTSKLLESRLEAVEKAAEIKSAAIMNKLKAERLAELLPYMANADIYPLGAMEQSSFDELLTGAKLAHEKRIEEEKKQAALKIHNSRKEKLMPYWEFMPSGADEIDLSMFDEPTFDQTLAGVKEQKKQADKIAKQKQIDLENSIAEIEKEKKAAEAALAAEKAKADEQARLAKEKEEALKKEAEAKLAEEKRLADEEAARVKAEADAKLEEAKKLADDQAKEAKRLADEEAAKAKALADEAIKAEKEKAEALETELAAKKQEEERLAAASIAEDEKIKEEERLAALAPDKAKLKIWLGSFDNGLIPVGISDESKAVAQEISDKFNSFKEWADKKIEESLK